MKLSSKAKKAIIISASCVAVIATTVSLLWVFVFNKRPVVRCSTGRYKGSYDENEIASFKGIHYAKAPTGDLRWKAPEPVEKSRKTFDASKYGKTALQKKSDSEQASMNPEGMSEDCLTLNIWTKDLSKKNKPVMFWIHGGAYSYGGTADPLYDGKYIINEHPDMLIVTANYRVGSMGFVDFTGVPGAEEYTTSGYNGLLDQMEALSWVHNNISAFGGDPNNVTIFGESAGGGSVTQLLVACGNGTLFQHAIAQSGSVNFGMTHERFGELGAAKKFLDKAHATTMAELAAISESELIDIYLDETDGQSIASIPVSPLRAKDSITGEDPYQAILDGAGKDVDLIIGTVKDENRYFLDAVLDPALISVKDTPKYQGLFNQKKAGYNQLTQIKTANYYNLLNEEEKENAEEFLEMQKPIEAEEVWQRTALMNEYAFRGPAIKVAENHYRAGGNGKTYMYYFCKKNTNFDWIGACHASELSYVFHNLEDEQFSGKVVPLIADQMCGAWTSFAKNGNPTYNSIDWPQYDDVTRKTMFFNDDSTFKVEIDPMKKERELIASSLRNYVSL